MKAQCPECENNIDLKVGTELGEAVTCSECGSQLEVVSLKPAELDYAVEAEEEADVFEDEEFEDEDFDDEDLDDEDDEDWDDDEDDEDWDDEEDDEDDF